MAKDTILIVAARFYPDIADLLTTGAQRIIRDAGFDMALREAPGAFEIPGIIAMAAQARNAMDYPQFAGFVALGCVIRGETSHYDYVCGESARGLMDLSVRQCLAIGNGILTVETKRQALVRARPEAQDKGGGAALACLAMVRFAREFGLATSPDHGPELAGTDKGA